MMLAPVRSVAGRIGRLYARTPLRVRLVAALLVLVLAALAGAGVAATRTMQAYLIGRVDSQLQAVAQHPTAKTATSTARRGRDGDGPDGGGPDGGGRDRLPSAYVLEVLDGAGKIIYGPTSDLVDAREPLPGCRT